MGARTAAFTVDMDRASALGRKEVRKGGTGPQGTCHPKVGTNLPTHVPSCNYMSLLPVLGVEGVPDSTVPADWGAFFVQLLCLDHKSDVDAGRRKHTTQPLFSTLSQRRYRHTIWSLSTSRAVFPQLFSSPLLD